MIFSDTLMRFKITEALSVPGKMVGVLSYRASDTIGVWILTEDVYYTDHEYGTIGARAGTPSDGASIPRVLWPLIGPPLRDWAVAGPAAIHDLLYYLAGQTRFSRADADLIFARGLMANGLPTWKVLAYYAGVRLGGWIGWRRYTQDAKFQLQAWERLIDDQR